MIMKELLFVICSKEMFECSAASAAIMRALLFSFLRLQQKRIPRMSETSRAKPPMDTTTAISTVQSGGLGTIEEEKTELRAGDSKT